MIIYSHESFPFAVAKLIQGYEEWCGDTSLRFPADIFGPENAKRWMKHIVEHLKEGQKRPFVLAADDGRRIGLNDDELRQSLCSWIIFQSTWFSKSKYDWAWKGLKAWPGIIEKCDAAYQINKQCKLSVSINGKITTHNL